MPDSFNPLTNGADIVGMFEILEMAIYGWFGFNPLTNGADIVGTWKHYGRLVLWNMFQSPDQWGGYCGDVETLWPLGPLEHVSIP